MRSAWVRLSAAIFVVLVALTVAGSLAVNAAVHDQERRLLKERTNEVSLVLTTAFMSLTQQFQLLGGVLHATNNSPEAFRQSSDGAIADSDGKRTYALLKPVAAGYRVMIVNGTGLQLGDVISDQRTTALAAAAHSSDLIPTPVIGSGSNRSVGFAVGSPVAPTGTVLYQQNQLGPLGPPRAAANEAFNELNVVLYDSNQPRASQALVATARSLPLHGEVRSTSVKAGNTNLLLQVSPSRSLVGGVTSIAAWLVFGVGLVVSIVVSLAVEGETRRRRAAMLMYQGEHRLTESLQLSLLPTLPAVPGLQLGARYLPASADQQVGGDWYDMFEVSDGSIGVVVGDVLGHDISAAVLMSRVQTALRAYALPGEAPEAVLDRLDRLIATFDSERLVTVFYGVLSPPDAMGDRRFVYANAGHPPPLVYRADGTVVELPTTDSMLLGVTPTVDERRSHREVTLGAGSMLVLYTDGLVEVPGRSLSDLIEQLKDVTAAVPQSMAPDEVCDWLLTNMTSGPRRDDIAILVAQLAPMLAPDTNEKRWPTSVGHLSP